MGSTDPTVLSGCPVTVSGLTDETTSIYFKLSRPSPDARLMYSWNWGAYAPPRIVFSFGDGAYDDLHGECSQFSYHSPGGDASHFGEVTWWENAEDARDVYHCASSCSCGSYCGDGANPGSPSACSGPYSNTNGGFLYITITGKYVRETTSGWVNFEFLPSGNAGSSIKQAQLTAVQNIWLANCWPTLQNIPVFDSTAVQPNRHWSRRYHMAGKYSINKPSSDFLYRSIFSTNGSETDSDMIPFCDWLFEISPSATYSRVMALGVSDCHQLDYVRCSPSGDVIELELDGRGLVGNFDFTDLRVFSALEHLNLAYNKLSGSLPASVFSSSALETLSLTKNRFGGILPCPTRVETDFVELSIANNDFFGSLPPCLFTMLPKLRNLDVSQNQLSAALPAEVRYAQHLVTLSANEAGLSGPLPSDLKCIRRLAALSLRGNALSGGVPQEIIDGLIDLTEIDLGYNVLTGSVPHFPSALFSQAYPLCATTQPPCNKLRSLSLAHNQLSGTLTTQLLNYSRNQLRDEYSTLDLSYNNLWGPLPPTFRHMLTDAHSVDSINSEGNHFRCEEATHDWPAWVMRLSSSNTFGRCAPVPTISGANSAPLGQPLPLQGSNFLNTNELTCRLTSNTESIILTAVHGSNTRAFCMTNSVPNFPPSMIGVPLEVTAANYGDDYYDV